jgi:uncharacterized membrane protein
VLQPESFQLMKSRSESGWKQRTQFHDVIILSWILLLFHFIQHKYSYAYITVPRIQTMLCIHYSSVYTNNAMHTVQYRIYKQCNAYITVPRIQTMQCIQYSTAYTNNATHTLQYRVYKQCNAYITVPRIQTMQCIHYSTAYTNNAINMQMNLKGQGRVPC